MKSLVVFDLDGTLADTADDVVSAINHTLAPEGIAPLHLGAERYLVGSGGRALIKRAYAQAGRVLDDDALERVFQTFLKRYEANVAVHSQLYPGAQMALEELAAAGFNLAICTNKSYRPCCALLEALQITHFFSAICGNDSLPWSKPDPRALLGVVERAGGLQSRSLMVGDSRTDIDTAMAAAIPVVAVDFGYSDRPIAELKPDYVISTFEALIPIVRERLSP